MVYHGLSTGAGEKGGRTKLQRKRSSTPSLSSLPTKQRITPQDPSSSQSLPPIQSKTYTDTPPVTHPTVHHTPLAPRGPSTSIPVLASPKTQPFSLKLLTPSIKICAGCRLGYDPRAPPYDICITHPETRQMLNQATGCMMTVGTNAHYRVGSDYIKPRFHNFDPSHLIIPTALRNKLLLNPLYSALILQELGICL